MIDYDTSTRRPTRRHIAPCAMAYMRQIAAYRESLARRVCDLCDYDVPSVNLPGLLRLIDAAPDLRQLDILDRVILTCEEMAHDRAVTPH